MMLEAASRALLGEYERALSEQSFEDEADDAPIARHLPLLERLDAVEGSSVALYDLAARRYAFLTGSFRFLLGYDRTEAGAAGPSYFFERMHPEDLPFVLETTTRSLRFHYGLPASERPHFKLSFDFRMRREGSDDEEFVRIVQQVLALESDVRGRLRLVLIVNDAAGGSCADRPPAREMVDLRTGRRVLFPAPEPAGRAPGLSPREAEILGLVSRGMGSREIADALSLSVATVNNHRRHILEKMGARNSAEAVRYAGELGLASAR